MHLKNCPTYFIKDGKRVAVYHTVAARELIKAGWVAEEPVATPLQKLKTLMELKGSEPVATQEPVVQAVQVQEPVAEEVQAEEGPSTNLDDMTRVELMEFADANGIEIKSNALKADILEACKEFTDD